MADIRIQTQVEGLQQALSDIQTLRSQLESLSSINVQASGGSGGGGRMGGGGGMGAPGGGPANSVPIPEATQGHNSGSQSSPQTTAVQPGQQPGQQQMTAHQQQLNTQADSHQSQMLNSAQSISSAAGQGIQMAAGQTGFGGPLNLLQQFLPLGSGMMQTFGAESVNHLRDISQHLRDFTAQSRNVSEARGTFQTAKDTLEKLEAQNRLAGMPGTTKGAVDTTAAKNALDAAEEGLQAAQAARSAAGMGSLMSGLGFMGSAAGFAVGGLGVAGTALIAGNMAGGYYESLAMQEAMVRDEPRRQYMRGVGNRLGLGLDTKAEDLAIARNRLQYGQQIADIEARGLSLTGKIGDILSGGRTATEREERIKELEDKQAREETRIAEIDAPTNEMQRLFASGASPADWNRYRDRLGGGSRYKDEIIRNQAIVRMSSEIGLGAEGMMGAFSGQRFRDIDRLTPEERVNALGAIGSASYTNLALRGGGMAGMVGGNLNAALASMDFAGIRAFGAVSAGMLGPQGSVASDAEYRRIQAMQEQMVQLNYNSQISQGQRQVNQADIGLIRAGGMGLGASTDTAIFNILGQQAATYTPQIQLLQQQVQLTAGNPLVQQQYLAELRNVQAAQMQARDQQFGYEYNVGARTERLLGAQANFNVTTAMSFGTMADREKALADTLRPQEMAVNRLQTQLGRMYSGKESYTEEKEATLLTQLAEAQERLLRSTIAVDQATANLQYSFNNATRSIAEGSAQISMIKGGGGVSAISDMLDAQAANRGNVQAAGEEIQRLRNKGFAEDSKEMMDAKVRLSNAQVAVAQMPQQIVNLPYSARATEAVAENAFGLQILNALPGGYGLRRQMYAGQMAGLSAERGELDRQLEAAREAEGGTLSEGTLAAYNNRRRQILGQQVGVLSEMSYGWQNRLLSQVSGAPDMSAITPLMSYRAAIGAGVRLPAFGSTQSGVEQTIEEALMFGTMAGSQSPTGLAQGAFVNMGGPATVAMRGGPTSSPLTGMTLAVTVNGLPGTGVLRPNSGGNAMRIADSSFTQLTGANVANAT